MRNDIQKVVCERQRGNSSERSQKTRLKVNPKLFTNINNHHNGFEDFRAQMLDFSAQNPSGDIINGVDYCADLGPMFVSSARHRQEGRCSPLHGATHIGYKRRNENTKPIYRFLAKNVGRPWNDVYSEICAVYDRRSTVGYQFHEHIGWAVANDIEIHNGKPYQLRYGRRSYNYLDYPFNGFYVHPATGLLCEGEPRTRYQRAPLPVESIHWYDNTWFKLEVFKDVNVDCRCRHFKIPPTPETEKGVYRHRYNETPAVCIHGNEPTPREIWYVVKFKFHSPDEIYKVVQSYDYGAKQRYGLADGESHKIYYRNVPDLLSKAVIAHKKVANKKELSLIRAYIAEGGVHNPSPDPPVERWPY
jgi:hypothetical protein